MNDVRHQQRVEPSSPKTWFSRRRGGGGDDRFFMSPMSSPTSRNTSPFSRSSSPCFPRSKTPTPTSKRAAAEAEARARHRSRRGSLDDDDGILDSLSSKASSKRSTTPIMFSSSNGLMKPPAVEKKLYCTLEELCFGCVKKVKITRDVVSNDGAMLKEEEVLTIKVKPGWKKGTKITFEGMGNEKPGSLAADVIFVIAEKSHVLYRREGDELQLAIEVPLVKALTGCTIPVPLLRGGEEMRLGVEEVIFPGYKKRIPSQGMPKPKAQGRRGDLVITFLVDFPTDLTHEQRADAVSILEESSSASSS